MRPPLRHSFRVSQRCGILLCRQGVPWLAKGLKFGWAPQVCVGFFPVSRHNREPVLHGFCRVPHPFRAFCGKGGIRQMSAANRGLRSRAVKHSKETLPCAAGPRLTHSRQKRARTGPLQLSGAPLSAVRFDPRASLDWSLRHRSHVRDSGIAPHFIRDSSSL